jgi:hypothetical protein
MDLRVAETFCSTPTLQPRKCFSSCTNATSLCNIDGPFVLEGKGMIYSPALVQTSLSYLKQYVLARALAPAQVQVLLQKETTSCPQALLFPPFSSPPAPDRCYSHALARKSSTESPSFSTSTSSSASAGLATCPSSSPSPRRIGLARTHLEALPCRKPHHR